LREKIKLHVILTAAFKSTACKAVLLRQVDVGTVEKVLFVKIMDLLTHFDTHQK
jgi:hypothetical protein